MNMLSTTCSTCRLASRLCARRRASARAASEEALKSVAARIRANMTILLGETKTCSTPYSAQTVPAFSLQKSAGARRVQRAGGEYFTGRGNSPRWLRREVRQPADLEPQRDQEADDQQRRDTQAGSPDLELAGRRLAGGERLSCGGGALRRGFTGRLQRKCVDQDACLHLLFTGGPQRQTPFVHGHARTLDRTERRVGGGDLRGQPVERRADRADGLGALTRGVMALFADGPVCHPNPVVRGRLDPVVGVADQALRLSDCLEDLLLRAGAEKLRLADVTLGTDIRH